MEEVEKQTILNALERNRRNMTRTSEELGLARTTLYRKMKKYDI
jgi:transcriptional regulator of acetoin/glycerol metabolism